jgi:hypothetical protein
VLARAQQVPGRQREQEQVSAQLQGPEQLLIQFLAATLI